jgi:hypothetical protein
VSDPLHTHGCVICGQLDTDPRHSLNTGEVVLYYHFDCHAAADPPCELCASQLVGAAGVTGAALRAHLMRGA